MKQIKTVTLNPAFDLHYDMERFEAGKENYAQRVLCDAGGKGINISRALTANGVENTAYVILGDENGASFEAKLRCDGLKYVPFYTAGHIRENITLHPADDKETRISLDTFCVDQNILDQMEKRLTADAREESLLAFAGRLPRGIEKDRVIDFLRQQRTLGARLVVDSNSFTLADLQQIHPWFIKPNEQEIISFWGRSVTDVRDAANVAFELVKKDVAEEVMISLGGDGAAWSDGKQKFCFRVPKIENPVSTIGAGDSTIAGLLAATAKNYAPIDALRLALSYGTAACLTKGTLPPMRSDVDLIFSQIEIISLG